MIPDDPKFWWGQDIKFFGKPKATRMQFGTKVFEFSRRDHYPVVWFIPYPNGLRRFPHGIQGETRDWKLTDEQIKAFNRDWEKFHNGNNS